MKKKYIIITIIILLIIGSSISSFFLIKHYNQLKEEKRIQQEYEEKLKNAIIKVELVDDLNVPFNTKIKVSDLINNINGEIIDDYYINTEELGKKEVSFKYINEENIEIPYTYEINIIDNIPPTIWLNSSYSIYVGDTSSLEEEIMCADNYDDYPTCQIIGDYDPYTIGSYKLTFEASDSSNNVTEKVFTLNVISKKPSTPSKPTYTYLDDIIKKYKTENTKIGIDVSRFQGDIDYDAVKAAGVEFAFIRVGGTTEIDGEYFVDKNFIDNIEGFNRVGIPVGIYYYSLAPSKETAIKDANWVVEQIKDYQVDLPIAYDWENWSFYNVFHNSFYTLSKNAQSFLDVIHDNGYEGLLYSSKNFLESVWFDIGYPTWLAHYTSETNYQGDYDYWQLCSNGIVDGIEGYVDIDIMYLD